ncbi:hypothetical protein KUTeg_019215 [Tegillarca granosa]|uniref:CUB domain-containing protein n=1 Tax=Tegillarca granosa TaxID=220873 RepID=A0ABQ9EDZ3_TEGGR|nr:hypothetical protein KUTeg_019215 [Tegillarca granosa]
MCLINIVYSRISRHYVTEECGQVLGPEHGAYLEFDRDVELKDDVISIPDKLKGSLFECMIVIKGMPATKGETRYMAIHWRSFHLRDQSVDTIQSTPEDCKKAYVTVYRGIDRTAPVIGTFCGKDILNQNYEFEGLQLTLYFYLDYRNPDLSTPVPGTGSDTNGPTSVVNTTPVDTFPYPLAYIRLDVTNYDYECNDSIPDVVMRCNDSQRCIHDDLRCDFFYSRNCVSAQFPRDRSDSGRFPPALCWVLPTTTTQPTTTEPPPPVPFPWEAVVGPVAAILSILTFLFCCCRPGFCAWRCGRLRNVPCLNACGHCLLPCCPNCVSPCCDKICPCCAGGPCCAEGSSHSPTGAAAASKMRNPDLYMANGSAGGLIGWPGKRSSAVAPSSRPDELVSLSRPFNKTGPGSVQNGNLTNGTPSFGDDSVFDERDDPEGLASGWLRFLSNDGGHLREQR